MLVSPRAFAQHVGVSYSAVIKAIQAHRLSTAVTRKNGRYRLDLQKGLQEWQASSRSLATPAVLVNDHTDLPSLAESRARKEAFQARLLEQEYLSKQKALVRVSEIEQEAFRVGRILRDQLLTIPDRVAELLAAETNANNIHALLNQEIHQVLTHLSQQDFKADSD